MDIAEIQALRLAKPFKAFNLVLMDGRRLPVDEPYYLGWADDDSFLLHTSVGDWFERVPPESVASVDFDDPAGLRWKGRVRRQKAP
jgi:hypothetical protein